MPLGAMRRGYTVFERKGRPVHYVKYLSVDTLDWVSVATPYRLDDPAGKRKAVRFGEMKAAEYVKLGSVRKQEAWTSWVPQFLKSRYSNSQKTLTAYEGSWGWVCTYLLEKRVMAPAQLTYNHAIDFVPWRMSQKRHCGKTASKNTALCNLKVLSLVMGEAVRRGFALSNPVIRLGIRKDPPKEKAEMTEAEVALIRAAVIKKERKLPVAQRWMSISFEIAYHQGCRLTETEVPLTAIDEDRGQITFLTKGKIDGQRRILPTALHPNLVPLIKELRSAGATHTCHLPKMAAKEWWALRRELGLEHLTFHSTRVGVVSQLARAGVSEQMAMRFVGHSSRLVHRIYQKLKVEDLSACTAALSFSAAPTGAKG